MALAYQLACDNTDPGNAGYLDMTIEAGHAATAGTVLEGCSLDEFRVLFWAEHALISRAVRSGRGRA